MTATLSLVSTRRRHSAHGPFGFLSRLPCFHERHHDALDDLAQLAEVRTVRRGQALWRAGEAGDSVVIVRSGVVVLSQILGDHLVTLDVCGRGCFLGVARGARHHDATIHEDGTLLVFGRRDFESWLSDHPIVVPTVLGLEGARTRRMADWLTLVSMHGAKARLALLFLDLADRFGVRDSRGTIIDVRLTHREMASLIGATRETVSVAIVDLRNAGLVATEARRVVVVDELGLHALAGR